MLEVSIICNAYNHEEYIEKCLIGFIQQQTTFSFEVLIHDDCSSDRTRVIIEKYAKRYPNLIFPIYQLENKYSKNESITLKYQLPRARGRYLAICEGDDYWTSSDKLQKQYEILENYPSVDMCAHKVRRVAADDGKELGFIAPSDESRILSLEEVIYGGGGFLATNSLMFRREVIEHGFPYNEKYCYDYALQISGAKRAGIYYLKECLADYRVLSKGSWSARSKKNKAVWNIIIKRNIEMLHDLDAYTLGDYHDVIDLRIRKYDFEGYKASGNHIMLLSKQYRTYFNELPIKEKIGIMFYALLPFIYKMRYR